MTLLPQRWFTRFGTEKSGTDTPIASQRTRCAWDTVTGRCHSADVENSDILHSNHFNGVRSSCPKNPATHKHEGHPHLNGWPSARVAAERFLYPPASRISSAGRGVFQVAGDRCWRWWWAKRPGSLAAMP